MITGKLCAAAVLAALTVAATPFTFSTGAVTNSIAMASRPATAGKIEIEAADDFNPVTSVLINKATFTGLLTGGGSVSDVSQVVLEIYRVFPNDSNVGRTSGPPTFSTSQVPTRVNSPSDVALASRDSAASELSFSTTNLGLFTASNSVLNGINPKPNQLTGGEGAVSGTEVRFNVTLANPILLPAGHYFFVPQVAMGTGEFYWLSGSRPIDVTGTPFTPDLQAWIRNENLAPDWLRVGTDIVGGTTFNGAFTVNGSVTPEPSTFLLLGIGVTALIAARRRRA